MVYAHFIIVRNLCVYALASANIVVALIMIVFIDVNIAENKHFCVHILVLFVLKLTVNVCTVVIVGSMCYLKAI